MNEIYTKSISSVMLEVGSNIDSGLSEKEITDRQELYGKNEFKHQESESLLHKILDQFKNITTIILLIATALSFILAARSGEGFIEPFVILSIVIMNIILALTQENNAQKALSALEEMNSPECLVLRNGVQQHVDAREVVPGDIIILETGSLVPADARLLTSTELCVDESILTGESEPSEKDADAVLTGKAPTGDQVNLVFSGCLVTAGRGTAVVIATGMNTQMGNIAGFLNPNQKLRTTLQSRLDNIGKIVSFIAIISAIALLGIGLRQGEDIWNMVYLAVSLAVAAVPETLSLIVTLILSHGVKKMVSKNALIRKLPAVETLGSTSVICTDKTGTLTQNLMTITKLWLPGMEPFKADTDFDDKQTDFLIKLALASNAVSEVAEDGSPIILGNPTEAAIIRLLLKKNMTKHELDQTHEKVAEIPFSSARKIMTTVHKNPTGGYLVLTKGALGRIPFKSTSESAVSLRKEIHDSFASQALRVIALGYRYIDVVPEPAELSTIEQDLEFVGLIGLIDPPRPECANAIQKAKKAGIRTVMITGDHAITASAIAKDLGILSETEKVMTGFELEEMSNEELCENIQQYSVFARVSPMDKIRIVEAWQEVGEVVAMTGDGVNDAPALMAADVGVAMGKAGTEVAKSASDMVLTDDNFSTIVEAVYEGRNVFSNIRKTIYFLLVCNISEICIIIGAQLMGWGSPLTPVMLLLINVIGDGIPGLQLAYELSDPRLMERKPIGRTESFINSSLFFAIVNQIIIFSLVSWAGYYFGSYVTLSNKLAPSHIVGQTVAFLVVGWTSILHIFTVRSRKSIFKRTLMDNPALIISAVSTISLFAIIVAVPPVARLFGMVSLSFDYWLFAIGLSLIPTVVAETGKVLQYFKKKRKYRYRIVRLENIDDDDL